jgi:YesN/AraC family two-component response regulator
VNPWLTMKKLKEFGLEFASSRFQVALVRMDPSEETFTKLTQDDISLFYAGAFVMIAAGLPERFHSWQVGFEDHTMRILLNLPLDASSSDVVEGFNEFIDIFKRDSHLHNVSIGLGEVHSGVEHIHTSYNEARIALERVTKASPNSTLVYTNEKLKQDFILPEQDSNKFHDDLLLGRMAPTLACFEEILLANQGAGKSKEAMKKLIFQIYLLVQQVCQAKMISESKLMGPDQMQLALWYNNLSFDEMAGYVRKLIPAVAQAIMPNAPQKIEKTDLEDYLEENFCRDISLDDLAERYKTTPAYVSKCIKNILGVPLMGYLAEKRIAFAVYLLTETKELSIEEIASICGYPNRIHFTRVFKERRGMPPTEYRKHVALENENRG